MVYEQSDATNYICIKFFFRLEHLRYTILSALYIVNNSKITENKSLYSPNSSVAKYGPEYAKLLNKCSETLFFLSTYTLLLDINYVKNHIMKFKIQYKKQKK